MIHVTFAAPSVRIYLAPAGGGKTHELMAEMTPLLRVYRPDEIAFVTFTRKGVANGIERALLANPHLSTDDLTHFKTLHALCFRELGLTHAAIIERKDIARFNELLGFEVQLSDAFDNQSEDSKLLTRYDAIRSGANRGIISEGAYDEARYERLVRAYEAFKRENSLVDFYDCLNMFKTRNKPIDNIKCVFIDEAQDLTELQWEVCQLAFQGAEVVRIAGDDFQCQPAGSLVLTNKGEVPIESINDDSELIVYDRTSAAFYGKQHRTYHAKKSQHWFDGNLVAVKTADSYNRFTPNHRMIVKWAKRDTTLRCVYLMRKGNNYRIGQCQMFNGQGATHLSYRMRQEDADALWVLEVSSDKVRILVREQVLSVRHGLPQLCFTFRKEIAGPVFAELDTRRGAIALLEEYGLDIDYPLLSDSRIRSQSGGTSIFECEAVNLIPEVMMVPKMTSSYRRVDWVSFHTARTEYHGYVYGLDVEKYHTYVTGGGIATHNCLFTYAGANPAVLIDLASRYETVKLERSYRLPEAVYHFARGITSLIEDKVDKDFRPAKTEKGFVMELTDRTVLARRIRDDIAQNGTPKYRWYLLFRNNCFIKDMADTLEQYVIPYHTAKGFVLAERDIKKIKRYLNYRVDGFGSPEARRKFQEEHGIVSFDADFSESNLIPSERRYVYSDYVARYGVAALEEMAASEPSLLLSTTHRVKGGEADYVAVFSDCTRRVQDNLLLNSDEELRVFYVACTRAKLGLYLMQSTGNYGLDRMVDMVKEQCEVAV